MTMFITVCAIIVIGIVAAVVMDRIMRTMVVVGVVSIWTFGMTVLHYARKALMMSVFRTDSSIGKEKML